MAIDPVKLAKSFIGKEDPVEQFASLFKLDPLGITKLLKRLAGKGKDNPGHGSHNPGANENPSARGPADSKLLEQAKKIKAFGEGKRRR